MWETTGPSAAMPGSLDGDSFGLGNMSFSSAIYSTEGGLSQHFIIDNLSF